MDKLNAAQNDTVREHTNKRPIIGRIKILLGKHIPVPIGAIIIFMVAWILLGSEIGIIFSKATSIDKSAAVNVEEADIRTTMQFLKTVFLIDPTDYVLPEDPEVKRLSKKYRVPSEIYDYVFENIKYNPSKGLPSAIGTLRNKESSCYGIAALVVSLLRANGVPPDETHVTVAMMEGNVNPHAWAELKIGNNWQAIDATTFAMGRWGERDKGHRLILSEERYLAPWPKANLLFEYNDKSFRFVLDK